MDYVDTPAPTNPSTPEPADPSADAEIEYVVRWEIPVLASSPRAAAEIARQIQQDPANLATFFEVFPGEPSEHDPITVNLDLTCTECGAGIEGDPSDDTLATLVCRSCR